MWDSPLLIFPQRSLNIVTTTKMASLKTYSIHGRGLKLNTKEDIEPYLKDLRALKDVEEIHIGGKGRCVPKNNVISCSMIHILN